MDEHLNPEHRLEPFLDGPGGLVPCPGEIDFTAPDSAVLAVRPGWRRVCGRCPTFLPTAAVRGGSWRLIGRPVEDTGFGVNSPTLTRLRDGRLCLTYGLRRQPLRTRHPKRGAGNHDLGYPRTVQNADGTIVTVY